MQQVFDLAIAWSWEFDADFVDHVRAACRERNLSLLQITSETLAATLQGLSDGDIAWRILLDRAWDVDEAFYPLSDWSRSHAARILNDRPLALRAWDKATMHLEFITAGLNTPYTVVLPPFEEAPDMAPPDLRPLGRRFIVKPAHGGGGTGVKRDLTTWAQIQHIRQENTSDKYLIQAWVTPRHIQARPAWFRVLYALDEVLPFWWDVHTHVYRPVSAEQESLFALSPLRNIARAIAQISRLDIFSTEVAQRDEDGLFVSVDYVNDPIDMRLQSKAVDGVPDLAVKAIAARIVDSALRLEDTDRGPAISSAARLHP